MILIDTHTHLYGEAFDEDRTEMVQRAVQTGITQMYLPNIDAETIQPMYDLCTLFPDNCFAMMGLHPGSINENWEAELEIIRLNLFSNDHIAVGEIGMDLYWDKTFKAKQAEAFRIQIIWAKELHLPIVIHAREAFDEIFEILEEVKASGLRGRGGARAHRPARPAGGTHQHGLQPAALFCRTRRRNPRPRPPDGANPWPRPRAFGPLARCASEPPAPTPA